MSAPSKLPNYPRHFGKKYDIRAHFESFVAYSRMKISTCVIWPKTLNDITGKNINSINIRGK